MGAQAGVHRTSVIRNGQMLGVAEQRSRGAVSSGSMQLLGEARLQLFYNDGNNARARAWPRSAELHRTWLWRSWQGPAHFM